MENNATPLEHPADIARYLTSVLGKNKIKEIKFGYRLRNDEPAIKFKIILRFPYSLFARKRMEEQVDTEIARAPLSSQLKDKLFFQIE
jgi:hypothetical protein